MDTAYNTTPTNLTRLSLQVQLYQSTWMSWYT